MKALASLTHTLLAAAALAPAAAGAQDAVLYRASPDTVYVQTVRDHHAFVLRGADTVGAPAREVAVERQLWSQAGPVLRVVALQSVLGVRRPVRADTLTLTPRGRVDALNGRGDVPAARLDFVARLPAAGLAPAHGWSDTASARGADGYARTVIRDYRVVRDATEGGRRVVEVEATGTVRLRDAAPGRGGGWFEGSGPIRERYTFDVDGGRLARREWTVELTGTVTAPTAAGGSEVLPAGVRSRWTWEPIAAERARLLTRDLPGGDSSVTRAAAPVLLHTVSRGGEDVVESGVARGDGVVGTARSEWRAETRAPAVGVSPGMLAAAYTALWTACEGEESFRVERRGRRLRVEATRRGETRDTVVEIPDADLWAVADYGMEEHLVPVLLRIPAGTAGLRLAVYRPHAARWDVYATSVGHLPAARLVTLVGRGPAGEDARPVHLVVTDDGDLLAAQGAGPDAWERVPLPGSRRSEKVEDLVAMVKGADLGPMLSAQR